jgi:hypothetical protein
MGGSWVSMVGVFGVVYFRVGCLDVVYVAYGGECSQVPGSSL